jgi:hypothetical protein
MSAQLGSLSSASTGTAVMIHAPAARRGAQRRELRPAEEVALQGSADPTQQDRCTAGGAASSTRLREPRPPIRPRTPSQRVQRAGERAARSCACGRGRRGDACLRKIRLLELTTQASQSSVQSRRLQSALEGAPSPSARPAPPPRTPPRRRAGRFAKAAAGSGSGSGSGPAPPGPAARACPAPRPAPRALPAAQLAPSWKPSRGGCTRAERAAAAAKEAAAAVAAQHWRAREARRRPHGRARTAGGARAGEQQDRLEAVPAPSPRK